MKKLVMVLALLIHCQWVNGQERFFNFVEGWRNNYSVELDDSYEVFGLGSFNPGIDNHFFQYNSLDLQGDVIGTYDYTVDSMEATSSFGLSQLAARIGDDLMIAALMGDPSESRFYGALFIYDMEDQDMELVHVYDDAEFSQLRAITIKNDSSLLLSGVANTNGPIRRIILYETDLAGEPRWDYTSSCGAYCNSDVQQILPLSNGHTALLYKEHDLDQPTFHDREKAVLVVLDEEGQEVWSDEPGQHEDYRIWPGGMVELDGEILVSYTDPYYYDEEGEWQLNFEGTIRCTRFGISGGLISEFDFDGTIPNGNSPGIPDFTHDVRQMQLLEDGNLLLSGDADGSGILLKMTPSGELVWIRHLTPNPLEDTPGVSQYTHIHHTLPTSDGGFLCTGEFSSDPSIFHPSGIQTAFALKVDEYGCLEEGCGPIGLEEQAREENGILRLYPNPAKEFTTVDFRIDKTFKKAELILSNMPGQVVIAQAITSMKGQVILPLELEPGAYLAHIRVDGLLFSTERLMVLE